MSFLRAGRVAALLAAALICVGCGNTFRPVATPEIPTLPNPGSTHFVFALTANAPGNLGSIVQIDVSGDTVLATAPVGLAPVHASLASNAARVIVANTADSTANSVTPASNLGSIGTPVTITLPAGSGPTFAATSELSTAYVANSALASVSAISTTNNVVTAVIPVGNNPVALTETPNALSLYAVNQADNTVTSINPQDHTVRATIPVGVSPVWAVSRLDSTRVYVLNSGDGTLSTIDTATDQVIGTTTLAAGANYMFYDGKSNRIFVTNPVANTVTVLLASSDPPAVQFTIPVAASPMSAALLPDGSRLYVASISNVAGTTTSQATVINAISGAVQTVIPLETVPTTCLAGTRFPVSIAAGGSSARVYVATCDAGVVSIITTLTDTKVLDLTMPVSAFPPPGPGEQPPPQQPVFLLAGQ